MISVNREVKWPANYVDEAMMLCFNAAVFGNDTRVVVAESRSSSTKRSQIFSGW